MNHKRQIQCLDLVKARLDFAYEIYRKLQIQSLEKFSVKKFYPTIAFYHKSLEARRLESVH
jgi:hypothetical protein